MHTFSQANKAHYSNGWERSIVPITLIVPCICAVLAAMIDISRIHDNWRHAARNGAHFSILTARLAYFARRFSSDNKSYGCAYAL